MQKVVAIRVGLSHETCDTLSELSKVFVLNVQFDERPEEPNPCIEVSHKNL